MTEFLRTRAALVRAALASLLLVGFLFAFVFPTRTWLAQRNATADRASELSLLRQQTEALEHQADVLRDDREVERLARSKYGYVMPGEQAWAVVPPPTTTTTTAPPPPPATLPAAAPEPTGTTVPAG